MDDQTVQARIEKLIEEEQKLRQAGEGQEPEESRQAQLESVKVELDAAGIYCASGGRARSSIKTLMTRMRVNPEPSRATSSKRPQPSPSSSTVRSAVGRASSRSSGIGSPLLIDNP